MVTTYKKSGSGFYVVTLGKVFEDAGFLYKPGMQNITVNEDILKAMIAAEAVLTVAGV